MAKAAAAAKRVLRRVMTRLLGCDVQFSIWIGRQCGSSPLAILGQGLGLRRSDNRSMANTFMGRLAQQNYELGSQGGACRSPVRMFGLLMRMPLPYPKTAKVEI